MYKTKREMVEDWLINNQDIIKASGLDKLRCPHCGTYDAVQYVDKDQRTKYNRRGMGL